MVCSSTPNWAFVNSLVPPEMQKKMPIRTRAAVTGIHSPARSIVSAFWIMYVIQQPPQITPLAHSHFAAGLGIVPADEEGKQEHYARRNGQHPENIDLTDCLYLSSHSPVKQAVGPPARTGNARAGVHEPQAE